MLHLYWGDGKGKTTAAMGLALRALGHGRRVVILQFLKDGSSGEIEMLRRCGAAVYACPNAKFTWLMTDAERAEARRTNTRTLQTILQGSFDLLVLDEPANALDAAGMKQVRDLLRTLCRDWGTTVFLSSHLLSEVEQIADTVGILHRGRLLREISLSELAAQSLTYIELVTPDVRAAARVLEELGVRRFKVLQEGVVRIYEAPMAPEELSRALALQNVAIASFQKHADTLEDYYLRLTGEEN